MHDERLIIDNPVPSNFGPLPCGYRLDPGRTFLTLEADHIPMIQLREAHALHIYWQIRKAV
ncbi:hypothetical protein D3C87_2049320 [compost metagenome]